MPAEKADKQLIKRKKFIEVDVPILRTKIELIGNAPKELVGKTIKLDVTRQLKGKSVELILQVELDKEKPIATPKKITLMPYFIRRMIRKRISYVEDSFLTPSQENLILIKPFLITKRRVSRAIRKTLRNKTKNWIEDYISAKTNHDIFSEILSNRMQKSLSLMLKKTYPLSLCEIRILEIKRPLSPEEIPKIKPKEIKPKEESIKVDEPEEFIDQMKEIEDEKIRIAQEEIKKTQEDAAKLEPLETKVPKPAVQEKTKEDKPKKEKPLKEKKVKKVEDKKE